MWSSIKTHPIFKKKSMINAFEIVVEFKNHNEFHAKVAHQAIVGIKKGFKFYWETNRHNLNLTSSI